jgi:hypothetical protein
VGLALSAVVLWWMPLRSRESMLFIVSLYLLIAGVLSAITLWNVWTWYRVRAYRAVFRDPRLHRFGVLGVGVTLAAGLAAISVNRAATVTSAHTTLGAALLFLVLFAAVAPITLWAGLAVGTRLDGWYRNGMPEELVGPQ